MDIRNEEKIKQQNLKVFKTLFLIFVIVGTICVFVSEGSIKGEKRYTVATIDEFHTRGSYGLTYSRYWFNALGKTYYGEIRMGGLNIDQRFIVAFSKTNPKKSKLLYDIEVKGRMQVPDSGWSKIPDEIVKK